jgi:hypothetical protein
VSENLKGNRKSMGFRKGVPQRLKPSSTGDLRHG